MLQDSAHELEQAILEDLPSHGSARVWPKPNER